MNPFPDFYKDLCSDVQWYEIKGYEGQYIINKCGDVIRLRHTQTQNGRGGIRTHTYKSQIMKPYKTPDGYFRIVLKGTPYAVHRLVALNFIDNPENMPVVNHLDHNRINNYYKNLEWCTQRDNVRHAANSGRMSGINSKLTREQVMEIKSIPLHVSSREVGILYNICSGVIRHIRQGIAWKHV